MQLPLSFLAYMLLPQSISATRVALNFLLCCRRNSLPPAGYAQAKQKSLAMPKQNRNPESAETLNAEKWVQYLSAFDFSALRIELSTHPQAIRGIGWLFRFSETLPCQLLAWLKGQTMRNRSLAHVVRRSRSATAAKVLVKIPY
jgi:hypothetical protein